MFKKFLQYIDSIAIKLPLPMLVVMLISVYFVGLLSIIFMALILLKIKVTSPESPFQI